MNVVYQSPNFAPERVAARYVRCNSGSSVAAGLGRFRVFECVALEPGHWLSKIASGATIREFDTDGEEIPADVQAAALEAHARGVTPTAVRWA